MKKNLKKGQFMTVTKSIILIATLAVLILLISGTFNPLFDDAGDKSLCAMSFLAASMTKTATTAMPLSGSKLDCEINKINLTLADITKKSVAVDNYIKSYSGEPFIFKDSVEQSINKEIASQMISAWQTAGAGRLNLFENWWTPKFFNNQVDSWDTKTNCVIFSRIRFDEALVENLKTRLKSDKVEIRSLNEWLKKNTVPWNKAITQYDYLSDDGQKMLYGLQYTYKVDSQDPLTIVFMRVNMIGGDTAQKYWATIPALLAGAIGGAAGGAKVGVIGGPWGAALGGGVGIASGIYFSKDTVDFPKAKSYILLMPSSKVTTYCSDIKN